MKPRNLIVAASAALIMLKAMQWWRGYAVDVTGGLGPLFPFTYLMFAMVPTLVAISALIPTIRGAGPKGGRVIFLSLALLILGLQWVVPSFMMAGFKARMSQFGEPEFIAVAAAMRAAAGPTHKGDLLLDPALANTLADAHPILRVTQVRAKGYVDSRHAQLRWGSGLTGAFAVDIWNGDVEPPIPADAADPRSLYPNVRLVWIF